jgi:serine/threonine protein kinase/tetratricopeptide (TPR) repeat protein
MPGGLKRLEEIFLTALEKAKGAQRDAFLREACGTDEGFRRHVEALLRHHDEASSFLESPLPGLMPTVDADTNDRRTDSRPGSDSLESDFELDSAETIGSHIGPYKLLQRLGEGGMGTVYLAEQEHPVRRRVALKIIKAGMNSAQVLARFEAERQALALMDHPNIAKVLDAGTVGSNSEVPSQASRGKPFLVMEVVHGIPITKYCDQEHLTPRERLELFIPVCQAVQHAHQKGIIHRDLKPSNVLIALYDGKPIPKVIDFGVAKAREKLTERTMFTEVGQLIGTLEYMAPEQAELNNLDIDTRADIYSLGGLLYELLTGSPPFTQKQLRNAAFSEMLRMIREVEPPKPSTRLSDTWRAERTAPSAENKPANHRRASRSALRALRFQELDWIVMKCLEKERSRRYETANGLAMDLRRYLADEPVLAGPPSAAYRLRKFVRRNRGPVLAASIIVLLLVGGIVGTSLGFIRAEGQRQTAEDNEHTALAEKAKAEASAAAERQAKQNAQAWQRQAMDALRATTDDVIEQLIGSKTTLGPIEKAFLERTLQRWQAFAAVQGQSVQARAIRTEGAFRVAILRAKLGERAAALAGLYEAKRLGERLIAEFPAAGEFRLTLALIHQGLGFLFYGLGKLPEAEAAYQQALGILADVHPAHSSALGYRLKVARIHNELGIVLRDLGKRSEAEWFHRQALTVQDLLTAESSVEPKYRQHLAMTYNNLGNLLRDLGKRVEAEAAYRQALTICEKLAAEFPASADFQQELAQILNNLGVLLKDLARRKEAEAAFRKAVAIGDKLIAEYPAVPDGWWTLATLHNGRGTLFRDRGKFAEAEAEFQRAKKIGEKLAAEHPAVPVYRQELATSHNNLGSLYYTEGKYEKAEAAYRQMRTIQQKLAAEFPASPRYRRALASSQNNLTVLLRDLGRYEEAQAANQPALCIRQQLVAEFPTVPEYQNELAGSYNNRGLALQALGKPAEAEAAHREALRIRKKLVAAFPDVAEYRDGSGGSHYNLGLLLHSLGRRAEAEAAFRQALAIHEKLAADFPSDPEYRLMVAASHGNLGALLHERGRHQQAEAAQRQELDIRLQLATDFPAVPKYRRGLAAAYSNYAVLLRDLGRWAEAETAFRQSVSIDDKLAAEFPKVVQYRHGLAKTYNDLGALLLALSRPADAQAALRPAIGIFEKLAGAWPDVVEYRIELAVSQFNFGNTLVADQKAERALNWHDKAIEVLASLLGKSNVDTSARRLLCQAHMARARILDYLKRHAEAAADWDKAVDRSPESERWVFRLGRAQGRVRAGQVDAAIAEADELAKSGNAAALYGAASVFALAADRPNESNAFLSKEKCAQRAVALLRQAVAQGWKNAGQMKGDADLKALHRRDDFQKLLAELESKEGHR